ncbi:MAG: hypothetical protein PHG48_04370, partial [Eubacteriales bacterium]|nr:hypothetical protein [Eubacteriales bacterium]
MNMKKKTLFILISIMFIIGILTLTGMLILNKNPIQDHQYVNTGSELLANCRFEDSTAPGLILLGSNGPASAKGIVISEQSGNSYFKMEVSDFGSIAWHLRSYAIIDRNILEANKAYQISFSIKSTKEFVLNSILIDFLNPAGDKGITIKNVAGNISIIDEWQDLTYIIEFNDDDFMKAGYSPEECDARLMFQFGKGLVGEQDPPVEVYIDNISMVEFFNEPELYCDFTISPSTISLNNSNYDEKIDITITMTQNSADIAGLELNFEHGSIFE